MTKNNAHSKKAKNVVRKLLIFQKILENQIILTHKNLINSFSRSLYVKFVEAL